MRWNRLETDSGTYASGILEPNRAGTLIASQGTSRETEMHNRGDAQMSSQTFFRYLADAYKMLFWTLCALGIGGLFIVAILWISQGIAEIFGWSTTAGFIIGYGIFVLTIPVLMAFAMRAWEKALYKTANTPE